MSARRKSVAATSGNGQHLPGINIQQIQLSLNERKTEILQTLSKRKGEVKVRSTDARDLADLAAENLQASLTIAEAGRLSQEVRDINEALGRIIAGTFGRCGDCGEPIESQRIIYNNCAIRCVTCEEKREDQRARQGRRGHPSGYMSL